MTALLTDISMDSLIETQIELLDETRQSEFALSCGTSSHMRSSTDSARYHNLRVTKRQLALLSAHTAYPVLEAIRDGVAQAEHKRSERARMTDYAACFMGHDGEIARVERLWGELHHVRHLLCAGGESFFQPTLRKLNELIEHADNMREAIAVRDDVERGVAA